MVKRITFRVSDEQQEQINSVLQALNAMGIELDESKLIRYLINKGLEKLKLEGVIK